MDPSGFIVFAPIVKDFWSAFEYMQQHKIKAHSIFRTEYIGRLKFKTSITFNSSHMKMHYFLRHILLLNKKSRQTLLTVMF